MASEDSDPASPNLGQPASFPGKGERENAMLKDGRAHNQPPEATKIKKGEVRNPYGRRGKPKPAASSEFEKIYLAEAARIVSHDADGPVTALKRVIRQDWHSALVMGNEKAAVRVLATVEAIERANAARRDEF